MKSTRPASLGSRAPAWGVLGVTRLHYTLATGQITSKTGAGRYALATFPRRWQRVVDEGLRIRRGGAGPSRYRTPLARRREALGYIALVIADARAGACGAGRHAIAGSETPATGQPISSTANRSFRIPLAGRCRHGA